MQEKILIIDFGSQYTQLIARKIRECKVYNEIVPYHHLPPLTDDIKGVVLSGSPFSVTDPHAPIIDISRITAQKPLLAICYGAQLMAKQWGGEVARSLVREYGRAQIKQIYSPQSILNGMHADSQVWMSHGDSILKLPENFEIVADTEDIPIAAYQSKPGTIPNPATGLQFHPEVYHTEEGMILLSNFLFQHCGCSGNYTPEAFISEQVSRLKHQIGNDQVVLGLSGGVDSTVAAMLLHEAIGQQLHCIFVNNGLLRKGEFEQVLNDYEGLGLQVKGVDASVDFLDNLSGVTDPEQKRKHIGKTFIEVFEREAKTLNNVAWLAQGTIYPDVIESISVHGPSVTIKSHHNVGGLPEKLNLKIVEPLRTLFKDEVRKVGFALGIPESILHRHPFPGPGLAIRILGEVTPEKVRLLQEADELFMEGLKSHGLYRQVWQAGVILLPIQSVGVMGDERTYEQVVALRAVSSTDGMTADWCPLPYDFLARISNQIINKVKGINRVVYDISSKPPATIEWE